MDIQEEIARTLAEHDHAYDSDCGLDFGCACGAIDEYKSDAEHAKHLTEALTPLLNRVRAEGWFAGYDKGNLDGYFGTNKERENSPYADFDPYREQNSEGNET